MCVVHILWEGHVQFRYSGVSLILTLVIFCVVCFSILKISAYVGFPGMGSKVWNGNVDFMPSFLGALIIVVVISNKC